jgi:hypothetical protein
MVAAGFLIGLASLGQAPPPSKHPAADAVTLRDGKVVLGQLLESDRRGPLVVLVRRAWAGANAPEKLAAWEKAEAPLVRKAEAQRRERLRAWKLERKPDAAGGDRISPWIDRELARLAGPDAGTKSALMVVKLGRSEVKAVDRKSKKDNRMLRLGWLSNLPEVEAMPRDDLAQAIDGRGFSADAETPVSVDALLPIQPETDAHWMVRRAATEVVNDAGGRLLRYQGMILPEPAAGEAPPAAASLNAALGTLKELLGEAPVDPLPGKLRELAGQGRAGVIVTRLELSPDFSTAAVETSLWARAGDRWVPAIIRSTTVRPDDLPADAGAGLADDPQVKAAFGLFESLGLGEVPPELKRRSLSIGAATKMALGQARASLDGELNALALPLEAPREAPPAGRP